MKYMDQIRPLIKEDIVVISEAFNQIGWNKPASVFEGYLKEAEQGERLVWVAHVHDYNGLKKSDSKKSSFVSQMM